MSHQVAVTIAPLATEAEARACASIMATSDPWITLGRNYDLCLQNVRDPDAETYVASTGNEVAGFIIIVMKGAFTGYIRSIAVHERHRGRGLGSQLMEFAEQRIFRDRRNVFICVSSFNQRARELYLRLGYQIVGELPNYMADGHSEWLLRKTTGPLISGPAFKG